MIPHNKLSKEEFLERVKKANPNIDVVGNYVDTQHSIKCVCKVCGYGNSFDWTPRPSLLFNEKACPICNGKQLGGKTIKGINDLETWCKKNNRQDLLQEWDYEDNSKDNDVPNLPSEISKANPRIKVHWICSICGFKFVNTTNKRTTIDKRTGHSVGCPHCSKAGTSFSELAVLYYLEQVYPDILHRDRTIIGKEVDIFIPKLKTAIEFDGGVYHKDKLEKDNIKDQICKDKGIRLIRIRDIKLTDTNYAEIIYLDSNKGKNALDYAIKSLFGLLKITMNVDVNTDNDYIYIMGAYRKKAIANSLKNTYPNVAKEWDVEKNNGLLPSNFSSGEAYKAWWKCSTCGNVWKASIYSRCLGKHGCPKCGSKVQGNNYSSNRAKIKSIKDYCAENNLKLLLEEWDYEENKIDINTPNLPEEGSYSCNRKIHWKCSKCGFKWAAEPHFRYKGKCQCPACNNKIVRYGENDLLSWCSNNDRQDVIEDWCEEENSAIDIATRTIRFDSYSKVYWKCSKCGHKWLGRVADRTIHNKGCEMCARVVRAKKHQKKVLLVETGQVFDSIKEAGITIIGKPSSRIVDCCKGKCKTAYGYHWKYVEE